MLEFLKLPELNVKNCSKIIPVGPRGPRAQINISEITLCIGGATVQVNHHFESHLGTCHTKPNNILKNAKHVFHILNTIHTPTFVNTDMHSPWAPWTANHHDTINFQILFLPSFFHLIPKWMLPTAFTS